MAKPDTELYGELRSRGVRRGVAKKVAAALAKRDGDESPKAARKAIANLSAAVNAIESRMSTDERRRRAAQKAAKTRGKQEQRRSKRAQKAARSRVDSPVAG